MEKPELLQNKTVLEVLETIDWTDAGNREAYQAAVARGVHTVYCDVAAQNYPVSKMYDLPPVKQYNSQSISHGVFRTHTLLYMYQLSIVQVLYVIGILLLSYCFLSSGPFIIIFSILTFELCNNYLIYLDKQTCVQCRLPTVR